MNRARAFALSFVVGAVAWFGQVLVGTNYYDEQPDPWWLQAWGWACLLLVLVGVLGFVSALFVPVVRRSRA